MVRPVMILAGSCNFIKVRALVLYSPTLARSRRSSCCGLFWNRLDWHLDCGTFRDVRTGDPGGSFDLLRGTFKRMNASSGTVLVVWKSSGRSFSGISTTFIVARHSSGVGM